MTRSHPRPGNSIEPDDSGPSRREPVAVQLQDLKHLRLEDLSLNFAHIKIPKGHPLTDAEVQQAAEQFHQAQSSLAE